MDTGVPWFENEVTNVIREGRTNPPVPILLLGIEPDDLVSKNPIDYPDEQLVDIIRRSDIAKFQSKAAAIRRSRTNTDLSLRIDKIEYCIEIARG